MATVVDNTPAYDSDILPGDVIIALDGQAPGGAAGMMELINAKRGQTVEVTIVRGGRSISKRVAILN